MSMFGAFVLIVLLRYAAAQDANCDYTQQMTLGQTYYIYSPGYPSNYSGARQCRWIGIAPSGYQCALDCLEISLPATPGCSGDRLMISKSGDPQLAGGDVYCGRGSTTAVSKGSRISVGLITTSTTTGGRFYCQLRAQKIDDGSATSCSCGYRKRNRIVGGQETGVNEFPMMAGLVDTRISSIKCGCTIIDKRYVVTAAHCVAGMSVNDLAVVVGEHDITTGDSPATQAFSIERIISHSQYNSTTYDNDIAILRLAGDIVFSDRVGPACLPFKFVNSDLTGQKVTLLGWGTLFFGGPKPDTLQKVDVDVISQASCRTKVSTLTPRQFCTYTSGKDSCQDDSGGPALYTDPSTSLIFLEGVISYGSSCASADPAVSTLVPAFLPWIVTNTPGALYCQK